MRMNTTSLLPILVLSLGLLAPAAALATVTVTVSSPANGATVPTTVNIAASATTNASGAQVTGWHIYVDSVDVWGTSGPTSSINQPITMSTGDHTVLVRAWDSTGAFGSQTLTLHVVSSCASGICVTVTSPAASSTVASPVRFTASAVSASGNPITGFVVYSDNTNVYRNTTSSLDAWVILPFGSHSIYIRAWDSSGAFGTSLTFTITAQGTVIPTPLAGAVTVNNIDDLSGWGSCGDTGCAGGGANATSFPLTQNVASPSRDGASTHVAITGPAFADALWWYKTGSHDDKTNFLWDFWFYVPASSSAAQALEFDVWQSTPINGTINRFMFGSECNYQRGGLWDGWNEATRHWVPTSFPCGPFSVNTWHHLVYFVQRVGDNRDQMLYGNVTIDGATTQWNLLEPVQPINWASDTGVQFQLDENGTGTSLEEWFDSVKLTMW
jgi:hypothetical protein